MTLPANYYAAVEAESLRFAHEWIEKAIPAGIFHADAERQWGRAAMKWLALTHPFGADEVVYFAEHGSSEADFALREIIAERTDRNEPLGAVFGAYNIRILNPRRLHPGPKPARTFVRDLATACLVAALIERCGLGGQHKTTAGKPSACKIAAQALAEAGIVRLTPKAVEKIWRRFLPAWAAERAAAGTRFAQGFPTLYRGLYG
jgi:hypothetical protein